MAFPDLSDRCATCAGCRLWNNLSTPCGSFSVPSAPDPQIAQPKNDAAGAMSYLRSDEGSASLGQTPSPVRYSSSWSYLSEQLLTATDLVPPATDPRCGEEPAPGGWVELSSSPGPSLMNQDRVVDQPGGDPFERPFAPLTTADTGIETQLSPARALSRGARPVRALVWILSTILWSCAPETIPTPAVGPPEVLEVSGVSGVAGLEDLVCSVSTSMTLSWSLGDQLRARGTGRVVVPAREVVGGTWTCSAADERVQPRSVTVAPQGGNVLVILMDDVGIDNVGLYGVGSDPPPTPNLDGLAERGVLFRNAWALPECSPTRASLLTGRYPRRTGIGSVLQMRGFVALADAEVTIPEVLATSPLGYRSALAGKWHLAPLLWPWRFHPAEQGFERHMGSMDNLQARLRLWSDATFPLGYYFWEKNTDGVLSWETTYATTETTDDALALMTELGEPWFVLLAYNAAHSPWDVPPPQLLTGPPPLDEIESFDAAITAMDTEIGRLLAEMPPDQLDRTTIVALADNGTPQQVVEPPVPVWQSKGGWMEGGSRVPLIVAGPLVSRPGAVSDALVHVVDVLPTVAALAGASLDDGIERDGLSLLPYLADPAYPSGRGVLWTEKFFPNGEGPYVDKFRAVRDASHHLVLLPEGEMLYRLGPGPLEETWLPLDTLTQDDADALERLRKAMIEQEAALGLHRP
ncbi:MAG TPA: hypothetical protein ENK18_25955 [Deltaproteobacteria bacterium]|nr:hypothetical protein [Deltaproteobacteria bacterium]